MKIIENLVQGSDDWKAFRESHLGASESAAILGLSPYSSSKDIWEMKTGRSFGVMENDAMRLGTSMEPEIREEWEMIQGKNFTTPTATHDDYPFISASLDGFHAPTNEIIEVKFSKYPKMSNCIAKNDVEHLKELYPQYWVQVNQQMFVSGAKECTILTLSPIGDLVHMVVPRDDEFIDKTLVPGLVDFWRMVTEDTPPPLTNLDYTHIDSSEATAMAQKWIVLNDKIKDLQKEEKAIRSSLIDLGDDGNLIVGNLLKMSRCNTKRTDFKAACEASGIDTSKYTKEGVGYYRFTPIKEK